MRVTDVMQRDVITVDESLDLSTALQIMVYNGFRHLPVVRDERMVGLLSERDVLAARPQGEGLFKLEGRVGDVMTRSVESIAPSAGLEDAAARMALHKVGCLPVVEDGKVQGLLTRADVLGAMAQCPVDLSEHEALDVASLMTRNLAAVHGDDSVTEAAAMMLRWGVRHLPVIDGLKRVRGILSDRDVRSAVGNPLEAVTRDSSTRRLESLRVEDIMTPEPRTVHADESAVQVVTALLDEHVGALPVVDDEEHLVGMISYVDVLRRVRPLLSSHGMRASDHLS